MSFFGLFKREPDPLSEIHPFMIEAWAKQGLVMDLKTGDLINLEMLTRNQQLHLWRDYNDYRCEWGDSISKEKRGALNKVFLTIHKNKTWQPETPPAPPAPAPTP